MGNILNLEKKIPNSSSKFLSVSLLLIMTVGILFGIQNSYAQIIHDTQNGSPVESGTSSDNPSNITTIQTTGSQESETPIQFISNIRSLLNQTSQEYVNQNYTGAQALATEAYLDNYEYVEAPLAEKNRTLMETTEIMMREELRQMILDNVSVEELNTQIENINTNLDKAEDLLSNSTS